MPLRHLNLPTPGISPQPATTTLRFGRCQVDLRSREVWLDGCAQSVRPRVFDLLVLLLLQRPRAVPRDELMKSLWKRSAMSHSVLSRTVMEARRAIGDSTSEPMLIATVHSIGYRFDGQVVESVIGPPQTQALPPPPVVLLDRPATPAAPGDAPAPAPAATAAVDSASLASLQALLASARAAFDRHDTRAATRGAERALAEAEATHQPLAQARAQVLCAQLATRRGEVVPAAELALAAQRLAQACGEPLLLASARLATAGVLQLLGDDQATLVELEAAWPVARQHGDLPLQCACENLLVTVYSKLNQPESALQWSRTALDTARRSGQPLLEACTVGNEAALWLATGDAAQAQGHAERARQAWQQGLAATETTLAVANSNGTLWVRLAALCQHAVLLTRLHRCDEAPRAFAMARQAIDSQPDAQSPAHGERMALLALEMGRLRLAQGDSRGARDEVQAGIQQAEAAGARQALPALYELACRLAEAHGDMAAALASHRQLHQVQIELQNRRNQARTRVLSLRLEAEQSLVQAAAERQRALAQQQVQWAARARQQLSESPAGASTATDLPPLGPALSHALLSAQRRDAPLCLALLALDPPRGNRPALPAGLVEMVLRQLGSLLREHSRATDLPTRGLGDSLALLMPDLGPRAAAAVCERLRHAVQSHDWSALASGLAVTLSVGVSNVAAAADTQAALQLAEASLAQARLTGGNRVTSTA